MGNFTVRFGLGIGIADCLINRKPDQVSVFVQSFWISGQSFISETGEVFIETIKHICQGTGFSEPLFCQIDILWIKLNS